MAENQIILGIDPAIASIGYGVICGSEALDYGVITTSKELPTYQRLRQIYDDVQYLCIQVKPHAVALEMPFFDRKNTNAGKVMQALGVIHMAVGAYLQTEPIFLHQSQVKSHVAQYGAGKRDIQQAVAQIFGLKSPPKPDDAADGLAIAYAAQCGARANIT